MLDMEMSIVDWLDIGLKTTKAIELVKELPEDFRVEVLNKFCSHCGMYKPPSRCCADMERC